VTGDNPRLNIVWIAAVIETVLKTEGITPQVIVDDRIVYYSPQERMALLYSYRDPMTDNERILPSKIHVIIGRDASDFEPVMVKKLGPAFEDEKGFSEYGKFEKRTLCGDYDTHDSILTTDGMKTRQILGVNCVNPIYEE